ncbi:hypothetical protein PAAG_11847 [Paracoccidioides lutzii Pb01]|uniref:Uncharacterized protein n=1 Tax=Paracoccidioides lutzii (strain ATCC MYA-826 / Pb01) TaxID=502779 RepID=A0A0A2VKG4_PARBA|nr:hypothetical protein PAAG_11847 [Paracoccidioides lutzii Pb01]KGQ01384.1 hypothetical protein PAAG_11847 [Paracoccidioides lutzii Pb01]
MSKDMIFQEDLHLMDSLTLSEQGIKNLSSTACVTAVAILSTQCNLSTDNFMMNREFLSISLNTTVLSGSTFETENSSMLTENITSVREASVRNFTDNLTDVSADSEITDLSVSKNLTQA